MKSTSAVWCFFQPTPKSTCQVRPRVEVSCEDGSLMACPAHCHLVASALRRQTGFTGKLVVKPVTLKGKS